MRNTVALPSPSSLRSPRAVFWLGMLLVSAVTASPQAPPSPTKPDSLQPNPQVEMLLAQLKTLSTQLAERLRERMAQVERLSTALEQSKTQYELAQAQTETLATQLTRSQQAYRETWNSYNALRLSLTEQTHAWDTERDALQTALRSAQADRTRLDALLTASDQRSRSLSTALAVGLPIATLAGFVLRMLLHE